MMCPVRVANEVLSYVRIIAWPTIAGLAIVLFRGAIRKLLSNIEEFEGFGVRAKIRQQVAKGTMTAEQALGRARSEPQQPADQRTTGMPVTVKVALRNALVFSEQLAGSVQNQSVQPLQEMKSSLNQLETSITAVLVVFAGNSGQLQAEPWTDLSPAGIERYLTDITGVSGWRHVIECRNILRDTLLIVCDHGRNAVSPHDASWFWRVGQRASGTVAATGASSRRRRRHIPGVALSTTCSLQHTSSPILAIGTSEERRFVNSRKISGFTSSERATELDQPPVSQPTADCPGGRGESIRYSAARGWPTQFSDTERAVFASIGNGDLAGASALTREVPQGVDPANPAERAGAS